MPAPLSNSEFAKPALTNRRWLIVVLILAGLLRIGLVAWRPESLTEDRDMYWGIARHLAAGKGFAQPDLGYPTAYRPPLYPCLLAGIVFLGGGTKLLAVVQIGLGLATVWLTWLLGRRLGLGDTALLAAAFVAANPLLIQATSLAMTETLCTFLIVVTMLTTQVVRRDYSFFSAWCFWNACLGFAIGLATLCRPTLLAFSVLAMLVIGLRQAWIGKPSSRQQAQWSIVVLSCVVTLAPWTIRNWIVFGTPIVTTTHGGYTLLLGNNDEAYRVEISEANGKLWDSKPWNNQLRGEMIRIGLTSDAEVARDRWMKNTAWNWISDHPIEFLESCWLRLKRFWNIAPQGADAEAWPRIVRWSVALFFVIELFAAGIGLWRLRRNDWIDWWPFVLIVASFTLVHLVYWSNLRMRAPVEPVLALLAAFAVSRRPARSLGDQTVPRPLGSGRSV